MSGSWVNKRGFFFLVAAFLLLLPWGVPAKADSLNQKQYIYDFAKLLTEEEVSELESLASELGKERNTAFLVITANGTEGKDIVQYVEDFYDEQAPGYDQPHGNTAILTIDMQERDVYLAGFKKAEQYLDNGRLDRIRNKITPDLSEGQYSRAFSGFIYTAHHYMGYEPGVNPENLLFKWWFQLAAALLTAAIIVMIMGYRSGGRVTVHAGTYMDSAKSGVLNKYDNFVRKTVTKQKKPSSKNSSGGGGGISSGGHSHSGSRGKF
ncbi:TPM domain-containing protein [Bacillus sp. DTU_2020_1000418_1_SI_GHA_SEK_038]|uniref:TPM domain-containing protein n=1 Tax=Bacillus sp. DTU_2020_1000418_1_SI_GHA_SEK_038 TaxID=3077585 RepID=UPI0028F0E765|nr:TPM domain-containing protein [Bacillus sp. DTU_2020_1000418_1_SI_GHA_SEK_038]WNS75409.1 TPM domain-containing protein [Bacillus sp. DTU_2020_1000418_1_SI_GHA_SEK_038]